MMQLPKGFKLISKFITGSWLYGCATIESDIDTRGVFLPSKEYFYGFMKRVHHLKSKKEDTEYHELRFFLKLILENNPNIIEYIFIPNHQNIISSPEWQQIINNKKYIVSKKCKFTFSGYAFSQINRIKRHRGWLLNPPQKKPERKDFNLKENRSTVPKEQIGAFNVLLAQYLEEIREFHKLKQQILEMEETKNFRALTQQIKNPDFNAIKNIIPISDNFLEALQNEKRYMHAKSQWDAYMRWKKNRNKKRAEMERKFGFDCKHGSHVIRLMNEGEELLKTGKLIFPRPEAKFLLAIKNGALTYDQLIEQVNDFDDKFDKLHEKSKLPHMPNHKKIDELCIKIIENYLNS